MLLSFKERSTNLNKNPQISPPEGGARGMGLGGVKNAKHSHQPFKPNRAEQHENKHRQTQSSD